MAKEDAQLLRAAGLDSNSSSTSSNSNNNTSHAISRNTTNTNTNKVTQGEDGPLLASTVMAEIAEFLKRFRPMICLAGFRCLGIARGNPDAWKTHVFVLRVDRIPNPSKTSRPWQRYQVVDAIAIPVAMLLEAQGDEFNEFLKQGEAYHKENVRVGCIGTIMTFINCDSAGQDLRLISWAGYGKDTWSQVGPAEEDWFLPLYNSVERISGRPEEKEESNVRRHFIEE
ncbi:hypothetical protein NLI96_g2940 [Meripilus lineatus]|uniref:Uncharacterized protein n=1 Tax=Meripilus lineatus TaxID=2056292 RepID=A0AAD5YG39_9APHY|nr:hypothetical protein NLI96_g2940 [Physisporinus lineatus]